MQQVLGAVDAVRPEVARVGRHQAAGRLGQTRLVLAVPPGPHVAAEVAVAEAVHGGEIPLRVDSPATAGPAIDAVAEAVAVPGVVEVAVVAHRHPAGPVTRPVPVDPGRRVDRPGPPGPAVARQTAPTAVVIGNPAPRFVGDPGVARGRPVPSPLPVGSPGGRDVRPPIAHALVFHPVARLVERCGVVGELRLHVARATGGALRPVGELGPPALERVRLVGGGELETCQAVSQRGHRFRFANYGRAAVGDDLGVAAAGHDACPGLAVVVHPGFDAVLAGLLDVDRRVGGDDARQLVPQRFVGDFEEQLAAFETENRHPLFPVTGEGEALENDAGVGVEAQSIAVGERDLQAGARADPDEVAGEQRLIDLERIADPFACRRGRGRPFESAQERVAGAFVGQRSAVDRPRGWRWRAAGGACGEARRREQQRHCERPGSPLRSSQVRIQGSHFSPPRCPS